MKRQIKFTHILIGLNILVFIAWSLAKGNIERMEFMVMNFLVSWLHLEQQYYWTLLTAAFSHNMLWHLLLNMLVLLSFGPTLEMVLGKKRFITFYLSAAIISSFSHAAVSAFFLQEPQTPALGASGAVAGVIFLFSLLYPKQKILLFALIPLPAIVGGFIFIGLDIWGLVAQSSGGGLPIGHGAHLGGAAAGILYYFLIFRKK